MKKLKKHIVTAVCCVMLTFTAHSQKKEKSTAPAKTNMLTEYKQGYFSQVFGFEVPGIFNSALYDTIAEWLGTPYCYSGKNEKGIDCSGFVNMIYRSVYGILLNGNSRDLFKTSHHLSKNKLKEGDLVFFKINHRKVSHVGLYLGDRKFAHSSTSNGVTISDLDEPYYKKHYAGGGRVD
ncbi:MAG TPA: NlpC/P60 family protein [Bacteroidia bacterium]|nr:NlpC/P60 family protein [Bacteroidia bacterium]